MLSALVLSAKLLAFRLDGAISSLKVTLTCVLVFATAPWAGTCCVTVGGVMSLLAPVSNIQVKLAGRAAPLVSCAPVVTVAVQRVPVGKLVDGVKVATRLAVALRLVLAEFHQRVVADQSHRQEYSKPSLERLPSQALEQELLVPVQLREQDQPQRFRQMAER